MDSCFNFFFLPLSVFVVSHREKRCSELFFRRCLQANFFFPRKKFKSEVKKTYSSTRWRWPLVDRCFAFTHPGGCSTSPLNTFDFPTNWFSNNFGKEKGEGKRCLEGLIAGFMDIRNVAFFKCLLKFTVFRWDSHLVGEEDRLRQSILKLSWQHGRILFCCH